MANRWWVYQNERFPVLVHGPLLLAVGASALGFSALLRGGAFPGLAQVLVAFATAFLFFFQLRISDEFKDFQEDSKYRPERPVPRGLITLKELSALALVAGLLQLALNAWLDLRLLPLLLLVWAYMGLMRLEFFAPKWLKAHPTTYLISHMLIMPLIYLYMTACDWLVAGDQISSGLALFLAMSFFSGVVIEIGRKVRAPEDEREGVDTYSALWGYKLAVSAWLGAMAAASLLALAAVFQAAHMNFTSLPQDLAFLLCVGFVWRFWKKPARQHARWFEAASALWTLMLHASLGLLPWVLP